MVTVTAAIILNKNKDKVLVAKRNKEAQLAGKWEFPGGKIKEGETPENCLKRELKEELNIDVEVSGFFAENIHSYDHETIKLLSYFAWWIEGEITLHVHEKVDWVEIEKLRYCDFAPADIPIVNKLTDKKSGFKLN